MLEYYMHFRVTLKVEECGEISRAALKGGMNVQQSEMEQFEDRECDITLKSWSVFIGQTVQCTMSLSETRAKDLEDREVKCQKNP